MNGELFLKGYKFSERLILNLQDKTVITGGDSFTAFEIFNMLESYFNRKAFSNYYLDKGTVLILNGTILSSDEFAVFRIRPTVNLAEELKISKRSMLGQIINELFSVNNDKIINIINALQTNITNDLNKITESYGLSFSYEGEDILAIAKLLQPVVKEISGQDVLVNEHDQFYCKAMLLDFVTKVKIDRKKLLLVEAPEYGLREKELIKYFKLLAEATIDNVVIYTMNMEIKMVISSVFNYNLIKNGKVFGFDDYDELEKELEVCLPNYSKKEIEQKVIEYILQPHFIRPSDVEFEKIVNYFLK